MRRLALVLGLVLAAVAAQAQLFPVPMKLKPIPDTAPLSHALAIGAVTGGSAANPQWTSELGDDYVRRALTQTFTANGMLSAAPSGARFRLDVVLLHIERPDADRGWITIGAHYTVTDAVANATVLDEVIDHRYRMMLIQPMADADYAHMMAEYAIRADIGDMLDKLNPSDLTR